MNSYDKALLGQGLGGGKSRKLSGVYGGNPPLHLNLTRASLADLPTKRNLYGFTGMQGNLKLWQWAPVANVDVLVRSFSATLYV